VTVISTIKKNRAKSKNQNYVVYQYDEPSENSLNIHTKVFQSVKYGYPVTYQVIDITLI
jgi:hypothetical protein